MARKTKGIAFLLLGCLLLLIAGGWYAYNIAEDQNAGRQADALLQKLDLQQNATVETPPQPVIVIEGDAFCGKVRIEKLGVELPVYDAWDYNRLKTAPCRYRGSIEAKDMIIAAHNYKSHFGALDTLKLGDEIAFTDAYGVTHLYAVCEIATLDGTAVSDMQSGNWDFTLFTCTKSGQQRVTVRCEKK